MAINTSFYKLIVNGFYDGLVQKLSCREGKVKIGGLVMEFARDNNGYVVTMPGGIRLYAVYSDHVFLADIIFFETFLYDVHFLGFDLSNWLVLDIGAYVGDTALYYTSRGATVVAVEPLPGNYEILLKNLALNPELGKRIIPINVAIADREGLREIAYGHNIDASLYSIGALKTRVRTITLKKLVEELGGRGLDVNRFKVRVLKMDCKGCEWDVVKNEVETLKLFDIIKIEYLSLIHI